MIHLEEINENNLWEVVSLELAEHQKTFVFPNDLSLAEAYAVRNSGKIALPLAAYHGDKPVGFVMIGKGDIDNPEAAWLNGSYCLWHLMVDKDEQRKGYGVDILRKTIELIRKFPYGEAKYAWLSFQPDNHYARRIYEKFGFRITDMYNGEEIIAVYQL